MIDNNIIEEIKERLDIVEVIGDFVSLKKSGSNYKALSPFTSEKTPSFFVSPSKQIFKCFSTGKGGDAIEFLREVDSMSYIEAIKYLGEKYGVEIVEKETDNTLSSERDSLLILLNKSKDFFVENLNTDEGKNIALTYFEFRKVSDLMIKKFELGYSLDAWNSLNDHLKGLKYSEELMLSAGLILEKNNKKYDRFRNRIIFPIHNISGKVIAFGARQIKNDEKQPKYINSPETVLYIKSNILYGIYQSKNIIRKEDKCYLVEGYTDVISLFQIGIENVVSSSGTSLTTNQIKLISRYTKNITILYDGDQAGINASLRGMDLILENDLNVRIISFPKNEDPDSYSKKLGKKEFLKFLNDNETDLIKFKTDQLSDNYKDDSIKKSELVIDVIRSISKIPNSIKRSIYIKDCSNVLKIDENILITEMNKLLIGSRHTSSPTKFYFKEEKKKDSSPKELDGAIDFYEKECLRMLVNYGTIDFQVFGLDRKSFIEYFLNEIEDVDSFINKVLTRGFTSEKWGELKPKIKTTEQKKEEEGDDYVPGADEEKTIEEIPEKEVEAIVEEPEPVVVRVSPHAKKLIDKYELDVEFIIGTGKNGGITKKDVEKYLEENGIEKKEGNVVIMETIREVKEVKKKDIYDEEDFGHHGSNLLDIK